MRIENEAFDEIAATIAHEIKNPVALALANLEIIRSEDNDSRFGGRYAAMEKQLRKINELIQYLVDCTLFDNNDEEIYIYDLIDDIIATYESANIKHLRFCLRAPNTEQTLSGSKKRLELVFSNIIKNAAEACGANGTIDITIACEAGTTVITVADDGHGVAPGDVERILSGGFTTKENGSGMGLTLCRAIISRLGGTLDMSPGNPRGCRVTVRLPD